MKSWLHNPIAFVVTFAVFALCAYMVIHSREAVEHEGIKLSAREVKVITAEIVPFRGNVTAYGNVEPAIILRSMAEVSGKISYLHPELKQGASLSAGTVVARIDPQDYQVSLKQTQAELSSSQYVLKQLEEEERTTLRSLALSKENLAVGEKELARIQQVYKKQLVSKSVLDAEQQKTIQIRQQVSELQGQLNAFNSRKNSEAAKIERLSQQVQGQVTTLGRTEITLPFDARIGEVLVDKGEFVGIGTKMFEALDITGVEINAQLSIIHMEHLVVHLNSAKISGAKLFNESNLVKALQLTANVRLVGSNMTGRWDARVIRMSESVDPVRRTLGIVVAIDDPYSKVIPGKRPPLLKGMYMAVDLMAPATPAMVIPRRAVHEGRVYVVDANKNLAIKAVNVKLTQGELAVVASGLEAGEQVIVTDLIPVIEGMPLTPKLDEEAQSHLLKLASGEV